MDIYLYAALFVIGAILGYVFRARIAATEARIVALEVHAKHLFDRMQPITTITPNPPQTAVVTPVADGNQPQPVKPTV